jgi:hypothetical protein
MQTTSAGHLSPEAAQMFLNALPEIADAIAPLPLQHAGRARSAIANSTNE